MTDRHDADTAPEPRTGVRETVRVMRVALRGLYRSRLPQMAAALAFRTLFALIPILVISVAIVGAFADPEDVQATFERAVEEFGFTNIVISDPVEAEQPSDPAPPQNGAAPDEQPEAATSADGAPAQVADADPPAESTASADEIRLQDLLQDLIDRLLDIPFEAIGAVGLLTLLYAAISMLTEIERAFNHVYRAKAGRSWGRRITQYWATLTLGALLIFLTFYTGVKFQAIGTAAGSAAGSAVSIAITALFFVLAYTTLPNTRVHVRTAAVGGLVAAVLWEVAKWAFRQYVDYSVSYAKLYGSIGILPLFMLWIYFTWLVVLFGLQVSFGLQHIGAAREMVERDEADETLTDPASVVPMMVALGEAFSRGKPVSTGQLADEVGIPAAIADTIIEKLSNAGFVHKLDGGDDRYALAMPPADIAIDRVLAEAHDLVHTSLDRDDRYADTLERLRSAEREALSGVSLGDLLSDRARGRLAEPRDP